MATGGKLIVFSAPSGSGKTTIVQHLLKAREPKFRVLSFCDLSGASRRRTTRQRILFFKPF